MKCSKIYTNGIFQTHLPGYVKDSDNLKDKGVGEIVCVSVNDPFVMSAWGKDHNAGGKVMIYLFHL